MTGYECVCGCVWVCYISWPGFTHTWAHKWSQSSAQAKANKATNEASTRYILKHTYTHYTKTHTLEWVRNPVGDSAHARSSAAKRSIDDYSFYHFDFIQFTKVEVGVDQFWNNVKLIRHILAKFGSISYYSSTDIDVHTNTWLYKLLHIRITFCVFVCLLYTHLPCGKACIKLIFITLLYVFTHKNRWKLFCWATWLTDLQQNVSRCTRPTWAPDHIC